VQPEYAKAAQQLKDLIDTVKVVKIDVANQESVAKYGITSHPAIIWMKNGVFVNYNGNRLPKIIVD
jgi:hypothetical protein